MSSILYILVTGGAGYIGSHTLVELYAAGHTAVVVDNLSNSSQESLRRVEAIVGVNIPFVQLDVADRSALGAVFAQHKFDAAIHFAGLKAVGESVAKPLAYYRNNIDSTLTLVELMLENSVNNLVFSSSATVYGDPAELPLTEQSRVGITNPYGQTKFMIEQILRDVCVANPEFNVTLLRYFNPVGAHPSGTMGEDPSGLPNNLLPYVTQVAIGKLDSVKVFGDDYDTIDGTGVRDYIHVVDLARGHIAALSHMQSGPHAYNLATGTGTSVLELIAAVQQAAGRDIPYQVVARRPGDVAACYASPALANTELNWRAELTAQQACTDSWRWQSQNPNGYTSF